MSKDKIETSQLKILSVEDSVNDFEILHELLSTTFADSISMKRVETREELLDCLKIDTFDIILSDFKLPGYNAFGSLEDVLKYSPYTPFICVSGSIGEETAIELLKKGAVDYVLKDRPERLPFAIKKALEEAEIKKQKSKTENALRESEAKFRDIFFKHAVVKFIVEPKTAQIMEANEAAEIYYGWSLRELKEMKLSDLNCTFTSDEFLEHISKAIKNEKYHYEVKHKKKNGDIVDVAVYASKLTIERKEYLHTIIYDISEQKNAEAQVKLLSRAVEQSSVSIIITNPMGIIEYVNPYFTKITGYSADKALGANPRILNSGYHSHEFYKEMWDTILSGSDWSGEIKNKKKNGEEYWEQTFISPIVDTEGKVSHFIAVKDDVTEKKQMIEDLVTAKEKAEEMNRIKSFFFANMSHELRTPFVGIMGYADLLHSEIENEDHKEMLQGILRGSKRMLETLDNILTLTKIEFEGIELKYKIIQHKDVIDSLISEYSILCSRKGLQLININPGLNITFNTDERIFREILSNLLSNAVKYTDTGKIEIQSEVESKGDLKFLLIKVSDTGIGIPKDKQAMVFDEFRQVSEGSTRSFQGAGLGLSIVKKMVSKLGGTISVKSEVGKGSTFIVSLPVEFEKLT